MAKKKQTTKVEEPIVEETMVVEQPKVEAPKIKGRGRSPGLLKVIYDLINIKLLAP